MFIIGKSIKQNSTAEAEEGGGNVGIIVQGHRFLFRVMKMFQNVMMMVAIPCEYNKTISKCNFIVCKLHINRAGTIYRGKGGFFFSSVRVGNVSFEFIQIYFIS